jgi:hypothetical protein
MRYRTSGLGEWMKPLSRSQMTLTCDSVEIKDVQTNGERKHLGT